ncbi:FMN-binding negative transcriptional regulator [Mycolicibacterium sp. CH28]|uniref:FMN-binding negative transcriptional regulator n=1 Tax=Mycolicibacterium sp. CH28 TaxID=2512237 RepID=UPI0010803EB2|nr:FMN-binding negative transcriptional regulator [Mycolicibacterium sp. CH28]TGD90326.1 FMN-binding negative transcriptional regulator [Mycolicibacterium sp. CH28]
MYVPAAFAVSAEEASAVLAAGVLAHLVTYGGEENGYSVTPVPLLYRAESHSLVGHVGRANPHWKAGGAPAVAIVPGPQAYISPGFYATKAETGKVVPTWNYEVLTVHGRLLAHDDPEWVRAVITDLTDHHEHQQLSPWQVTDAPEDYVAALLRAVVGIEVVIDRVEGKAKMSQNQPERNRAGVVEGLRNSQRPADHAVADAVARRLGH